jgi:hypothetical protein
VGNPHQSPRLVAAILLVLPNGDMGSGDLSKNRITQKGNFDGLYKQVELPKGEILMAYISR